MNCKLNYVDIDSKVIITVKDFSVESIPLYYTYYLDRIKYRHCSMCGKIIAYNNNENTKYCNSCREEKGRIDDKKYNLKR